ncbi:hypothetical protein IAR55_006754 [Kwoniella newhampshirensis]|uniref:NmrA-like domain-containing protein n=1 Tax=Kwoniella newhampshirensis TaxID=1651941 RepID=A0AAW0YSL6_9TREE
MSRTGTRNIIVFGATGKQGNAIAQWLSNCNTSSDGLVFKIFAVTRDVTSPAAVGLAALPGVEPIQGDASKASDLLEEAAARLAGGKIHGIAFALFGYDAAEQVSSGKGVIDAAAEHKVDHVIFSSTDFFGYREVDTGIPVVEAKKVVEDHLFAVPSSLIAYKNIIRPSIFFENFVVVPGYASMIPLWNPDKRKGGQSTSDIGRAIAECFANPDKFSSHTILELAGFEGSPEAWMDVWTEVTGQDLRQKETEGLPAGLSEERLKFYKAMIDVQCDGRVESTKTLFPWMMDLKTFLQQSDLAKAPVKREP